MAILLSINGYLLFTLWNLNLEWNCLLQLSIQEFITIVYSSIVNSETAHQNRCGISKQKIKNKENMHKSYSYLEIGFYFNFNTWVDPHYMFPWQLNSIDITVLNCPFPWKWPDETRTWKKSVRVQSMED